MIDGERFGPVFWKIRAAAMQKPRYISNRGGTRSGKTYMSHPAWGGWIEILLHTKEVL